MADDRLRRMALQWGLVGFLIQLWYLGYPFLEPMLEDIADFFDHEDMDTIRLRFGQLKPPIFKFPTEDYWVWLFCIGLIVVLVVLWTRAVMRLLDSR